MFDLPSTDFDPPQLLASVVPSTSEAFGSIRPNSSPPTVGQKTYLPDEAQIMQALEASDGVTWQSDIRETFDWSPSKTSRRLTELEERGQIRRYQIGRRKVVCLPGEEPPSLKQ